MGTGQVWRSDGVLANLGCFEGGSRWGRSISATEQPKFKVNILVPETWVGGSLCLPLFKHLAQKAANSGASESLAERMSKCCTYFS